MRGLFFALEGSDGSGKSSVLGGLRERFTQAGIDVLYTREPGGTPISEEIRTLLLNPEHSEMGAMTEALLYAASRAQHVEEVLRPALKAGRVILSDRYILSSLAYQGAGRGLGMDRVWQLNQEAMDGILPDCTLFLDVDPLTVLRRKAQVEEKDRLEEAGDPFFRKVDAGYREAIQRIPYVVRIDATKPLKEVIEDTWNVIQNVYDAWKKGVNE